MIEDIFPAIERVRYTVAPIVQVVAQFTFPTILKIEGSPPVDFQEVIRSKFPIFERQAVGGGLGGAGFPPEIAQILALSPGGTSYLFATADRTNTIALNPKSLTFTATKYDRWEAFLTTYRDAFHALLRIYSPSYFDRVGLRYSNAIDRTVIGTDLPWSQLLNAKLLGELADPQIEAGVVDARRVLQFTDPQTAESFILQHGLNGIQTCPGAYAIDFDFYVSKRTEINHGEQTLNSFHSRASRAFRWSIRDELHRLLQPRPLDESRTTNREYGT